MPYTLQPAEGHLLRPKQLCHVVLRTRPENYDKVLKYWTSFLGGDLYFSPNISFIRFDEAHHRIGILQDPDLQADKSRAVGLDHISFGYDTLQELAIAYKERKARGFLPAWCTNHGPATSMYYADPDGNHIECQVENFDRVEDAVEFMDGKEFGENPIGVDFDPEEFVKRVEAGENANDIKKRPIIGPRVDIPDSYLNA